MRIFGFRPFGPYGAPRGAKRPTVRIVFGPETVALGYEAADPVAVKGRSGGSAAERSRRSNPDIEKILRSGA